jgi:hypothetical protein
MTGIPKPPNWFRANASVDSAAIDNHSVGVIDLALTIVKDETAKTPVVGADAVMLMDSEDSSHDKKATLTVVAELLAGTVATSSLENTAGVLKVDIGNTTAAVEPTTAYKALLDVGGVNKAVTLANVAKATGEVFAATEATSALKETDGAGRVSINGVTPKTTPIAADSTLINDSADTNTNKKVTLANMAAFYGAMAQMPADLASSLFFFATEFDYHGSASAVDTKISNHSAGTVLAAKGKLIAAFVAPSQVADGTSVNTISISKTASAGAKMCGDASLVIADCCDSLGNCFMLMPSATPADTIVDPASEDIYAYAAASAGRTTGKVFILLVFQKTT